MNKTEERRPPVSEEAERAVLGSVLFEPERVMPLLKGPFRFTESHFYLPAHRLLWAQLEEMFREGETVDLLTAGERLKDRGLLERCGGYAFLEGLIDGLPTSEHAEFYAEQVRSKWILRRILSVAADIMDAVYLPDATKEAEKFLASIPRRFLSVSEGVCSETVSRAEAFGRVIEEIEFAKKRQDMIRAGETPPPLPYLDLPWDWMNEILGGGLRNYFYVVGAESSAGKTSLVAQLAEYAATVKGRKVLMLSMDADIYEHAGRDMSRNSGVSLPKAMRGFAGRAQIEEMKACAQRLVDLPIVIDSESFLLDQQEARMRMESMKGDLGLVVVDYFQLTRIGDHGVDMNENYRISTICKRYKQLARDLGCPVIGLSQLNRNFVTQNRFAMKQDLRGSGEIDEVAHGIWLIYKDREIRDHRGKVIKAAAKEENHIRPVWIDMVKNKTGPLGVKEFWMYANYFKFAEAEEGAFERAAELQAEGRPAHDFSAGGDEKEEEPIDFVF